MQSFCVGDDWQAINGFAGSDLKYFLSYSQYFDNSKSLQIQTNYRSTTKIVDSGNQLMQGKGVLAEYNTRELGSLELVDLKSFEPSTTERHKFKDQLLVPAILRIIHQLLNNGKTVAVLSRTNSVPWYIESWIEILIHFLRHLRSFSQSRHLKT